MRVLGINALFHDPAAALVVDGMTVAAAEEERFSRRKHGHRPVAPAAWELPEQAAAWCLASAGIQADELDAVGYSYDPALALPAHDESLGDPWDALRTFYAKRAPRFLAAALPGLDPEIVRWVPHHVAHAASAALAAPFDGDCAVLVLDGRGERASHLAGAYRGGRLEILAAQALPHSIGLLYEDLTEHLGFLRSSDEYKVMALASYGQPRFLDELRARVYADGEGGFRTERIDWASLAKARKAGEPPGEDQADLAASVQRRLEEVLVELGWWLYERTGQRRLAMAGGVALNCVANSVLARTGPFTDIWVQPAAGDAGTALGAALQLTAEDTGVPPAPMPGADLGRGFSDSEIEAALRTAALPYHRPDDVAEVAAEALAADRVVAWFQGRAEYGPRALGHRSLLAHPGHAANLERLNAIKGREEFRPVAPLVLAEQAGEVFDGPLPSPYMLFTHEVRDSWRDRIPAVTHVDGSARVQTVDRGREPLVARLLDRFAARTGVPVLVNTSLNTAGRPMVDSPRDVLELFGSAPVDLLVAGPFTVRRAEVAR
jgi:carbamoyltransferase